MRRRRTKLEQVLIIAHGAPVSSVCQSRPVLVVLAVLVVVLALALAASVAGRVRLGRALEEARADRAVLAEEIERLHARTPSQRRRARAVRAVVETAVEGATRLREGGVTGLLASSIDDLTRWAVEDRSAIDRLTAPDGTVTILFSDIEDSTALNDQLGDAEWVRLLEAHNKVVRACVERHGGHIVKSQGDGFMIVFPDAADAVRAGIAIQDALGSSSHRALRRSPIRVRVGIHAGKAVQREGDFFGTSVAMAARVAAQADGGQILVSDDVRQALRDVEDIVLVDVRETELKGLPGRHRLWQVALV